MHASAGLPAAEPLTFTDFTAPLDSKITSARETGSSGPRHARADGSTAPSAPVTAPWDGFSETLPGGEPPNRGDVFREPALGKTLRELVQVEKKARGKRAAKLKAVRDLFYQGSLAKRMAAFSESNGGLISLDDLKKYHADTDQPRSTL